MKSIHPPKAATRLLHHFGSSTNSEAIIGDLSERYRSVRSGGWYWQQVLRAIITGVFTEIRAHKLLAVCNVVIGWAVVLGLTLLAAPPFTRLQTWAIATWGNDAVTHFALFPIEAIIAAVMGAATGWTLSPRHGSQSLAMVLLFGLGHMAWIFGAIIFWSINPIYAIRLVGFETVLFVSLLAASVVVTNHGRSKHRKGVA
jgi:hypothetical protein